MLISAAVPKRNGPLESLSANRKLNRCHADPWRLSMNTANMAAAPTKTAYPTAIARAASRLKAVEVAVERSSVSSVATPATAAPRASRGGRYQGADKRPNVHHAIADASQSVSPPPVT